MSDAPPQAQRRSRFWLIASLCLNFFFLGLIVAGLIVARNRMIAGVAGGGGGNLPPEVIVELLPPSGAAKMCSAVTANTEALRTLGRALADARREVFRVFRTEPFDGAAFKSALDRSIAAQLNLVQLRQNIALQVAEKLDATERQELSRQLAQRFFSGGRRDRAAHRSLRDACAAVGQLPR